MPVVSQSIPNFINGISQQTPTQRNVTQGAEQINFQNRIVEGLTKRPPLDYMKDLGSSLQANSAIHSIKRDDNNKYIVAFETQSIKVWDLAGNSYPVSYPDGTSYLNVSNPRDTLKFTNIADYTFVANSDKTVLADTNTTTAKQEEFLIYCNTTNYGREYSVTLEHQDWAHGIAVKFQMPSGADASTDSDFRDSDKIIDILLYGHSSEHWNGSASEIGFKTIRTDNNTTLSSSNGLANYSGTSNYFDFEKYNSVIYGKLKNQSKTYEVTTSDGQGNKAMYAIRDTIQDFSDLPYYGKKDVILKVTGDEGDTLTDYHVKFIGNGTWRETIAPNTSLGLDDTTMPHALINNNDGTFTFRQIEWTDRTAGDSDTNPDPSFVTRKINNLTFYKNRLGVLAGENLILTENGSFFNFFSNTITQSLDTDPIDIASSGSNVNTLRHAITFNQTLLLFSDTTQFVLESSGDAPTPTDSVLNTTSDFDVDYTCKPVTAGKFVYFTQKRGNFSAVREYFADNDTLTNDSINVSISVSDLIPSNVFQSLSNSTEDTLLFLSSNNPDEMYVYTYFWDNNKKVQSAWSKWEFTNQNFLGGLSDDSDCYFISNDGSEAKLFKLDLRNLKDTNLEYNVYLDHKTKLTGTYDANTDSSTFTVPYSNKGTSIKVVDAGDGVNCAVLSYVGNTITCKGDHSSGVFVGCPFDSRFKLSPQYIREETSSGKVSITSGRYQLRTIAFDYEKTSNFKVKVEALNRDPVEYEFSGNVIGTSNINEINLTNGTFKAPVQSENTAVDITIVNNSFMPSNIISAEVEGFYHRRSQRR